MTPLFNNLPDLQTLVLSIPAVLMAFTFHEFGHAWVATLFGDDGPRRAGRLTLNPIAHLDLLGTIMILVAGFGWAKPVYVDTSRLRPRVLGDILVSLAGVAMNFLLALFFLFVLVAASRGLLFGYENVVLEKALEQIVWLNVALIAFNLIPIPPLDGFHVARYLLPSSMDGLVATLYRMGPFLLMFLFFTPVPTYFMRPMVGVIVKALAALVLPFF